MRKDFNARFFALLSCFLLASSFGLILLVRFVLYLRICSSTYVHYSFISFVRSSVRSFSVGFFDALTHEKRNSEFSLLRTLTDLTGTRSLKRCIRSVGRHVHMRMYEDSDNVGAAARQLHTYIDTHRKRAIFFSQNSGEEEVELTRPFTFELLCTFSELSTCVRSMCSAGKASNLAKLLRNYGCKRDK